MAERKGGAYCKWCGDPCDIIVATSGVYHYDNWVEFAVSDCCEEELVDKDGVDLSVDQIEAIYDPTPY